MFMFIPNGDPSKAKLVRTFKPDTLKQWKKSSDFERAARMYCAAWDSLEENHDADLDKRVEMLKLKRRDEIVLALRKQHPSWAEKRVQAQADTDMKGIPDSEFHDLAKKSMRFYVIGKSGYRVYSEADPNNNRLGSILYGLYGELDKDAVKAIDEVLYAKGEDKPKTERPFRAAPPAPRSSRSRSGRSSGRDSASDGGSPVRAAHRRGQVHVGPAGSDSSDNDDHRDSSLRAAARSVEELSDSE